MRANRNLERADLGATLTGRCSAQPRRRLVKNLYRTLDRTGPPPVMATLHSTPIPGSVADGPGGLLRQRGTPTPVFTNGGR